MQGYIYLIICTLNGKMYIGARKWNNLSTINNDTYMGSGVNLRKDMEKYGKKFFIKRILAIAYSLRELNDLEKMFIEKFGAVNSPKFYNLKGGGGLHAQTEKARQKMRLGKWLRKMGLKRK